MQSTESQSISELPHWLLDISAYYGGKRAFKLEVPFWLQAYPDLLELMDKSQKNGEIIAIPTAGDLYYNDGVPQTFNVEILASTWRRLREHERQLKEEAAEKHRATTITTAPDGRRVDQRNKKGYELLNCPISGLIWKAKHRVIPDYVNSEHDYSCRKGCRIWLGDLVAWRKQDLDQDPEGRELLVMLQRMFPEHVTLGY